MYEHTHTFFMEGNGHPGSVGQPELEGCHLRPSSQVSWVISWRLAWFCGVRAGFYGYLCLAGRLCHQQRWHRSSLRPGDYVQEEWSDG